MDKFQINKSQGLSGEIFVSASKNATLPILAASILFPFKTKFNEFAGLRDVNFFLQILEDLGANIDRENLIVDASSINKTEAEYDLVRKMRASILVLGPLLARFHHAEVSLPGGCAIGTRPVDIHLKALEQMGAEINIEAGYIKAKCNGGLKGAKIVFPFPSVGATENILTAAALAHGETIIENAAMEPEIDNLIDFLMRHGVEIEGRGTNILKVQGTTLENLAELEEAFTIIPDRIEAATYIIGALMIDSEVHVKNMVPGHLDVVLNRLKEMGAKLEVNEDSVQIFKSGKLKSINIETQPYPGFPTDVQAQMMALCTQCEGTSIITENIFENRFMHVPELVRMGAKISLKGKSAIVEGPSQLKGAPVMCTDLRASAALVLAGMVADGETTVGRVYHIDRGYEKIDNKLSKLGANIKRVAE